MKKLTLNVMAIASLASLFACGQPSAPNTAPGAAPGTAPGAAPARRNLVAELAAAGVRSKTVDTGMGGPHTIAVRMSTAPARKLLATNFVHRWRPEDIVSNHVTLVDANGNPITSTNVSTSETGVFTSLAANNLYKVIVKAIAKKRSSVDGSITDEDVVINSDQDANGHNILTYDYREDADGNIAQDQTQDLQIALNGTTFNANTGANLGSQAGSWNSSISGPAVIQAPPAAATPVPTPRPLPTPTPGFPINAKAAYLQNTGKTVSPGDRLVIHCVGLTNPAYPENRFELTTPDAPSHTFPAFDGSTAWPLYDANGDTRYTVFSRSNSRSGPAPDLRLMAVVGSIGLNGAPFLVGKDYDAVVPLGSSGSLHLAINDFNFVDNIGNMYANISITRPTPVATPTPAPTLPPPPTANPASNPYGVTYPGLAGTYDDHENHRIVMAAVGNGFYSGNYGSGVSQWFFLDGTTVHIYRKSGTNIVKSTSELGTLQSATRIHWNNGSNWDK